MTSRHRIVTITAAAAVLVASTVLGAALAPASADDADPVAPEDAQVTFLAGLPYRAEALEQAAAAISTPGSPDFRRHLSVEQAAARFGASDAAVAQVRKAASALDLRAKVDPTRLLVRLTGTVAAWEKAMGTAITYEPASDGDPYDSFGFPVDSPDADQPTLGSPDFWQQYYLGLVGGSRPAPGPLARAVTTFVAEYTEYVPSMDVPQTPVEQVASGLLHSSRGPIRQAIRGAVPREHAIAAAGRLIEAATAQAATLRALYYPGSKLQEPPVNPAYATMRNCINEPDAPLGTGIIGNPLAPENFVGQDQVFRAYGLTALQKDAGDDLPGRVTIISLGGGFSDDDLATAAECSGFTKPDVRITTGTGVRSPFVNVDSETTLDVQTVSATLKRASMIQMVQGSGAVNFSVALADAYSRALTTVPKPHAITLSYGSCEPLQAGRGLTPTVDALFQFAGVVGTTVAVSAGNGGSSLCQSLFGERLELLLALYALELEAQGSPDPGTSPEDLAEQLAKTESAIAFVQPLVAYPRTTQSYPASSPFVTAVGGTRIVMNADGTRAGEVVWNDTPYAGGVVGSLVGTGGPSAHYDAPWYQRPLTRSNMRAVPDISAVAGTFPSLPIVMNGQIVVNGGTSQASPMMAAALALVSSQERAAGRPAVGFANPWLYNVARRHPSTMYDVTIGDNQFAIPYSLDGTNIPACCEAGLGYDLATGLGVPQFDQLRRYVRVN